MNEEKTTPNHAKNPIDIASCLWILTSNLNHIENSVRDWLDRKNPPSKELREISANYSLSIIEELEKEIGSELSTKAKLEFCLRGERYEDWQEVFITALPNLRGEALGVLQSALRALPHPMWSDLLPKALANKVTQLFCQGHYLNAVRSGCDVLRAVIREKTGRHDLDSIDLVNHAYGKDGSFLLPVWEGHSHADVRRGYADMLRGAMTGIRNPHYHGTQELPELEAARLLVILGTLWERAEGTTKADTSDQVKG